LASCLKAQDSTKHLVSQVKYSPIHLLNRFSAIQIYFEKPLNKNTSVEIGFGYIVDLIQESDLNDNYFMNKGGYKLDFSFRYYLNELNSFVSFSVGYFNISYDRGRTFGYNCINGCDYFQYSVYEIERKDLRMYVSYGKQFAISNIVYFDLSIGFGITQQAFKTYGKPDSFQEEFGKILPENEERLLPLLAPGVKISIFLNE